MPHLPLDSMQGHQHDVPPLKSRGYPALFSNEASLPSSPASYSSSPPLSYTPESPVSGASPNNSPAKLGKKKARNRPPKHVRKGTSLARKSDELQAASPQHCLADILVAGSSELASMYDMRDTVNQQSSDLLTDRVVSAPINVPMRISVPDREESRLEAFSSPKWLGTGFSDRADATVMCSAQRCSGSVEHAGPHNFTYFARSMW